MFAFRVKYFDALVTLIANKLIYSGYLQNTYCMRVHKRFTYDLSQDIKHIFSYNKRDE